LIGGGISNEEELLIKPIEKIVNEKVYGGEYNPFVAIRKASFGNAAGIIGAACLVM
jgi:glucokinase